VPFTTPRTWTDGETITTVIMNQHIRDQLNALLSPPTCRLHNSVALSCPNTGNDTVVPMDTTDLDTDTMADLANNRIVIKTAGKYSITGGAAFAGSGTTGFRRFRLQLTRGGVTRLLGETTGPPNEAGTRHANSVATGFDCQVNDQIQLTVAQNDTAAVSVSTSRLDAVRTGT
jgi:hypothetical protein